LSEVAYRTRDIKKIKKAVFWNKWYNRLRYRTGKLLGYEKSNIHSISTFPMIKTKNELLNIANKLAWAYPNKEKLNIHILVSEELLLINFEDEFNTNIPSQRNYLNNISHIMLTTKKQLDYDLILITDTKKLLYFNPFKLYKTAIIDKYFFSTVEGDFLQSGYSGTLTKNEKNYFDELSLKNYATLIQKNQQKDKAYCFVTGPSFNQYDKFKYEKDSFKIICNSTVKDDKFLSYIEKPDLLVFADPVFHFSSSEYSATFRDHVIKVFKKYKCFIMVPDNTIAMLVAHYPILKEHIIGMKVDSSSFNFPTATKFWVKGSANILTLYMLPIASTISNHINIIGADGRNPDEKYFWQHSSTAQFGDLMQTVFDTHPSFFRDRDYKDYYAEHCVFLKELIEFGESKGKKYYSLTLSYIPALKKRFNAE
jgi:hypothetical protein